MPKIIDAEIKRCLELECVPIGQSGILSANHFEHPLFRPSVTRLAILLADSLKRAKRLDKMECDLPASGRTNSNNAPMVGYLVPEFRNSACHAFSNHREVSGNYIDWILIGPATSGIRITGFSNIEMDLANKYSDDVLIGVGKLAIYVGCDLGGAFNWLAEHFTDMPNRLEWKAGD